MVPFFGKVLPLLSFAAFFVTTPSQAREIFYLRSGSSLEAVSHTLRAQTIVLATATGTLTFLASEVVEIRNIPDPAQPAPAAEPSTAIVDPATLLATAAREQGLEEALVRSVAHIESGWRPEAVSPKGALGLMQLMPGTASELGVNAHDSKENAVGGARYLRQLLLNYHGDVALALAAYNAGPGAVAKYRGIPPYAETRRYVVRVLKELAREQAQ